MRSVYGSIDAHYKGKDVCQSRSKWMAYTDRNEHEVINYCREIM